VYLLACLFRENALVLPGLLLAAELNAATVGSRRARFEQLVPGFVALSLTGTTFLALRSMMLGSLSGQTPAEALSGQGVWGRTLTMLQVVPEWLRLSAWPAHLQADYSPAVIEQATNWGSAQSVGVAVLIALLLLALIARRGASSLSFGLAWFVVALLPASNVFVPTRALLAEGTLLLPSVGFVIAVCALAAALVTRQGRLVRGLFHVLVAATVATGIWRSTLRHRDWADELHLWTRTVQDAPLSSRAHRALGSALYREGREDAAIASFRTAIELYPEGYQTRNELGDIHRGRGECEFAVDLYTESLQTEPNQPATRRSRIACLRELGRSEEADAEAARALANPSPR
jgi:tetratricopeptide (TPR) repeat protein